jgi:glycosyltransferase involved in cell wall biosynthesis
LKIFRYESNTIGMKIIIVCSAFNIGGFSTFSINLSKALRRKGHESLALILQPEGELLSDFHDAFDYVKVLSRGIEGSRKYIRRIAEFINNYHPDALINNAVAYIQACYPILEENIIKLSVIHSVGGNEIIVTTANNQYIHHIVAVSSNIVTRTQELGRPTNNMSVIPIGIECNRSFSPTPVPFDKGLKLVYVGRLFRRAKNVHILPEITDALYEQGILFELLIIGDGESKNELVKSFERRPYHRNICFTGAVSPNNISALLDGRHIILLPSSWEGTPHVIIEAMSHGIVPVVSDLRGSTDQIINNGESGFLCSVPPEPKEYANKIVQLANHPQLFSKMSQEAIFEVDKYDIDNIAQQYLSLISNTCASAGNKDRKLSIPEELDIFPSTLRWSLSLAKQKYRTSIG